MDDIRTEPAPACPACGGSGPLELTGLRDRLHGVAGTWSFRRCSRCRSLWLDPRPAVDDVARLYPSEYFTHDPAAVGAGAAAGWRSKARSLVLSSRYGYPGEASLLGRLLSLVPSARERATFLNSPVFPTWVTGGRVLDVGCGSGAFLELLRSLGWIVAGVEPDPPAREAAASRGIQVAATLEEIADRPGFDFVTMSHVLEHVPDPIAFLTSASELLKEGGRLLVVTPNAASLGSRRFGADWFALEVPRHLAVYSPAGARAILGRIALLHDPRVTTSARIAGKMARERERVRRHGNFKVEGPLGFASGVARPRAFAAIEVLARTAVPVGEELVLEATR